MVQAGEVALRMQISMSLVAEAEWEIPRGCESNVPICPRKRSGT